VLWDVLATTCPSTLFSSLSESALPPALPPLYWFSYSKPTAPAIARGWFAVPCICIYVLRNSE
jgi:hypothetical protein